MDNLNRTYAKASNIISNYHALQKAGKRLVKAMSLVRLSADEKTKKNLCPVCGRPLKHVSGGAVQIVNGQVDMESTKPRYECATCRTFYREMLDTGYYDVFPLPGKSEKKKKVLRTGELPPMQLKKDADGHCTCPRCGEVMDFVEGGPVRVVDGKVDMDNVWDHFRCDHCSSVYRRIATTDYFQWSEK